jgi:hypothetical protein
MLAQIFAQLYTNMSKNKSEVRTSVQMPKALNDAYIELAKQQKTSKNAVIVNVLTENILKQKNTYNQ